MLGCIQVCDIGRLRSAREGLDRYLGQYVQKVPVRQSNYGQSRSPTFLLPRPPRYPLE